MSPGPAKQFEREKVLARAMDLFWEQGYEATGMADLLEHMGIGRQSLYDTFGDKRALFVEALGRYAEAHTREVTARLEAPGSALKNLMELFRFLKSKVLDKGHRGCLLVNVSAEFGFHDEEVVGILNRCQDRIEEAFIGAFDRAKKMGELDPRIDSRSLARIFITTAQGLALQTKTNPDPKYVDSVIAGLVKLIPVRRD